jgi:hypothetical protein
MFERKKIQKMRIYKVIAFIAISAFIMSSCGNKEPKLPADFEAFYERFHNDSVYQMEHIIFPLAGLPGGMNEESPIDDSFRWHPEFWEMHRPMLDEENEFIQQITILDEFTIVEVIRYKKTRFGMERRFAKMGDEWFLIYYVGMNLMTEGSDRDILGDKVDQIQNDENGDPILEIQEEEQ